MPKTIPRVAGVISIVLFVFLLGITMFGVAQGGSDPPEAERPGGPRTGPPPAPGPGDLRELTTSLEVTIGLTIDEASIACINSSPHLSLRVSEPLPDEAMITVSPVNEVPTASELSRIFSAVGPAQRIEVAKGTSTVQVVLSEAVLATEAETLGVSVTIVSSGGTILQSNALLLDADLARC